MDARFSGLTSNALSELFDMVRFWIKFTLHRSDCPIRTNVREHWVEFTLDTPV